MNNHFAHFAGWVSSRAGSPWAFLAALSLVLGWLIAGFFTDFTSTLYQLVINTGTTIVTFLMVFLIQNTQNRDAKAMHLKLDELIRAIGAADNTVIHAEDDTDEELAELKKQYAELSGAHAALKARLGLPTTNGLSPAQTPDERGTASASWGKQSLNAWQRSPGIRPTATSAAAPRRHGMAIDARNPAPDL